MERNFLAIQFLLYCTVYTALQYHTVALDERFVSVLIVKARLSLELNLHAVQLRFPCIEIPLKILNAIFPSVRFVC